MNDDEKKARDAYICALLKGLNVTQGHSDGIAAFVWDTVARLMEYRAKNQGLIPTPADPAAAKAEAVADTNASLIELEQRLRNPAQADKNEEMRTALDNTMLAPKTDEHDDGPY